MKTVTPNKLLTRLLILLAQIKAGNNLYKLKMKPEKYCIFLYKHNKITKKIYSNLIKSWKSHVDENLKLEIEFMNLSESLADKKMKKEIEQLLLKYKHGNNIHWHRKQQNEWAT